MVKKEKNIRNSGKPKCLDCGKEINYGYLRCNKCAHKGENNGNYKGGISKPKCLDCEIEISRGYLRCKKCAMNTPETIQKLSDSLKGKYIGEKHPMFGKHHTEETIQKLREKAVTFERIQISSKNGYGTNCYYDDEFFPSKEERNCYIYLKQLNYLVIHNWLNRFDFLVNGKIVLEYHPYDPKLTKEEYYNQRRKLLDKYGYKDLKLVVIKNLKEIKTKLGNKEK